jgi:hypothetical protein
VVKLEGQKSQTKPRHRCENNIKMDLQEVGWGKGMDWIDLAQGKDRRWTLADVAMYLRFPQ